MIGIGDELGTVTYFPSLACRSATKEEHKIGDCPLFILSYLARLPTGRRLASMPTLI